MRRVASAGTSDPTESMRLGGGSERRPLADHPEPSNPIRQLAARSSQLAQRYSRHAPRPPPPNTRATTNLQPSDSDTLQMFLLHEIIRLMNTGVLNTGVLNTGVQNTGEMICSLFGRLMNTGVLNTGVQNTDIEESDAEFLLFANDVPACGMIIAQVLRNPPALISFLLLPGKRSKVVCSICTAAEQNKEHFLTTPPLASSVPPESQNVQPPGSEADRKSSYLGNCSHHELFSADERLPRFHTAGSRWNEPALVDVFLNGLKAELQAELTCKPEVVTLNETVNLAITYD
ncbi:hypothetical protein P4O66_002273 [Electrophorus voltai]|uniref:Uncharacterized protein n=1 Tax=Electrophorus voltai TaxID=2609070 RepID=A0AAD9DS97_9TELE|nr:hypothetical protein P4O66_002273 [Electrophorus voltai]